MSNETHKYQRAVHHGRNVQRFREMFKMSQEDLADLLGDDWNQKRVSRLEAQDEIEPELIEKLAKALRVPGEALKNFTEDAAVNVINSTVGDNAFIGSGSPFATTHASTDGALIKEMIGLLQKLLEQRK